MKYLDAKKRIMFMAATVKYIKLITGENKIVITDEIEQMIAQSINLVFKDYVITTEEVNEIVTGVKSWVIELNNNPPVKLDSSTCIEARYKGELRIDEQLELSQLLELASVSSNNLVLKDMFKTKESIESVSGLISKLIEIKDSINTLDLFGLSLFNSVLISVMDKLLVEDTITVNQSNSNLIDINSKLILKDKLEITITDLIVAPFEITGLFATFDEVTVGESKPTIFTLTDNKIKTSNKIELNSSKADTLVHDYTLNFIDYISFSKYRFSLLKERDNIDINTLKS